METTNNERARASPEEIRSLVDFFSEINVLKRTARTGWRFAGPSVAEEVDDVAGHTAEVAQIAYILARMEGLGITEASKCAVLAVFHDNIEARLPERDKVATHYLKIPQDTFLKVMQDQTARLPKEVGKEIMEFVIEASFGESSDAIIARDADTLEASIQAKIFDERGYIIEEDILKKYLDEERFKTQSAKRLVRALRRRKDISVRWWEEILPEIT